MSLALSFDSVWNFQTHLKRGPKLSQIFKKIGIVGAGQMGNGIAQVAASSGFKA
ncbi:MAG: 3-hydroxyacyl-CoA dehydrogenase NAD-binding domain-containing protein, partial [Bdellovibrionales bacterium]